MRLWLAHRLLRDRLDPETFFRAAYMACFGKDQAISADVKAYRETGEVPPYVRKYVDFIQRKERNHDVQAL